MERNSNLNLSFLSKTKEDIIAYIKKVKESFN